MKFSSDWLMSRMQREQAKRAIAEPIVTATADNKEIGKGGLQEKIQNWCNSQWPRWVCDFPRTDLKSTLPEGRHDATIWGPFPACYLIETKAKGKKRSEAQLIWGTRLRALGWTVHVIYSLEEFLAVINATKQTP